VNLIETAKLLTIASGFDNRRVDELSTTAFHEALSDLNFEDARKAVVAHYSASNQWIMPADIRRGIKDGRARNHEHRFGPIPDYRFCVTPGCTFDRGEQ